MGELVSKLAGGRMSARFHLASRARPRAAESCRMVGQAQGFWPRDMGSGGGGGLDRPILERGSAEGLTASRPGGRGENQFLGVCVLGCSRCQCLGREVGAAQALASSNPAGHKRPSIPSVSHNR